MSKLQLSIQLQMPEPSRKPANPVEPQESVEDKVRSALECIDSGHDSAVEWSMINRLYRDLKQLKRPSKRAINLIEMIEPVLEKFGYFEVPAGKNNGA